MTDVPLLGNKSQKKHHLEPYSGTCDRENKKRAVLRQIAERVTMSIIVEIAVAPPFHKPAIKSPSERTKRSNE